MVNSMENKVKFYVRPPAFNWSKQFSRLSAGEMKRLRFLFSKTITPKNPRQLNDSVIIGAQNLYEIFVISLSSKKK